MRKANNFIVMLAAVAIVSIWVNVLMITPPVSAQQTLGGGPRGVAYQALAPTSGAAIGLTAATVSPTDAGAARQVYCTVETASIRYRFDGAAPTTSEGHLVATGGSISLADINSILQLKIIAVSTTAAVKCTILR